MPGWGKGHKENYPDNWIYIRAEILRRDGYSCQIKDPGCEVSATEVDHIKAVSQGGTHDSKNLRAVCSACHKTKTRKEAQEAKTKLNPRQKPKSPGRLEKTAAKNKSIKAAKFGGTDDKPWVIKEGPMWDKNEDGSYKLPTPKETLGYVVLAWIADNLMLNDKPLELTGEQARFILYYYQIDAEGDFVWDHACKVGPKGSGKDPLGSFLLAVEFVGPCRFEGWDEDGYPIARDEPNAWCQILAVSADQNENTLRYLKQLFTDETKARYGIEKKDLVKDMYANGRRKKIEALTSSPSSKEGNMTTFALFSETQHYTSSEPQARDAYKVVMRNVDKTKNARSLMITNAYDPSRDSVAQRVVENWHDWQNGLVKSPHLLMDYPHATEHAPYQTPEERDYVLRSVYGDAHWANFGRMVRILDDASNDVSDFLRFNYNFVNISADTWIDIRKWDACGDDIILEDLLFENIVLAGDGSLNEDSTALIGMVVGGEHNGVLINFGIWSKPKRSLKDTALEKWKAPREEIDEKIEWIFENFKVLAFWFDPSHKKDELGGGYWLSYVNRWHIKHQMTIPREYWAAPDNAINWDMTSSARQKEFVTGLDMFEQAITDKEIRHNRDKVLRSHIQNAKRVKNVNGHSIGKSSSQSPDKIDAAVCAVICWILYQGVMTHRKTNRLLVEEY